MQRWDLNAIETPGGRTSPVVLHSGEARAVLLTLQPGQRLGDHEVKEATWVLVVDGSAHFEEDGGGGEFEAGAGTLLHFEPTERRSLSSAGGCRLLLLLAPWPGAGHYSAEEAAAR